MTFAPSWAHTDNYSLLSLLSYFLHKCHKHRFLLIPKIDFVCNLNSLLSSLGDSFAPLWVLFHLLPGHHLLHLLFQIVLVLLRCRLYDRAVVSVCCLLPLAYFMSWIRLLVFHHSLTHNVDFRFRCVLLVSISSYIMTVEPFFFNCEVAVSFESLDLEDPFPLTTRFH